MNYIITITLLLLVPEASQIALAQSETLVGSVVRYDASMSSHTSQADFVVKLSTKGQKKYIRLRYAPNGFGFDAPPAKREQLVPRRMFSDGNLVWAFHAHTPRNSEEQTACSGRAKQYAPGKKGSLVEVERYAIVHGSEREAVPQPESLSCLIADGWSQNTRPLHRKAGNSGRNTATTH